MNDLFCQNLSISVQQLIISLLIHDDRLRNIESIFFLAQISRQYTLKQIKSLYFDTIFPLNMHLCIKISTFPFIFPLVQHWFWQRRLSMFAFGSKHGPGKRNVNKCRIFIIFGGSYWRDSIAIDAVIGINVIEQMEHLYYFIPFLFCLVLVLYGFNRLLKLDVGHLSSGVTRTMTRLCLADWSRVTSLAVKFHG